MEGGEEMKRAILFLLRAFAHDLRDLFRYGFTQPKPKEPNANERI